MKLKYQFRTSALVLCWFMIYQVITGCQALQKSQQQTKKSTFIKGKCNLNWPKADELYEDANSGKIKIDSMQKLVTRIEKLFDSGCQRVIGKTPVLVSNGAAINKLKKDYYYTVVEPAEVIDSRYRWYVVIQQRLTALNYMYTQKIVTEKGKIVDEKLIEIEEGNTVDGALKEKAFNYRAVVVKEDEMKEKYSAIWGIKVQISKNKFIER